MEQTVVEEKVRTRKIKVIEPFLSALSIIIIGSMLLWNWDGFWQTEIPALVNTQKTYFPVKFAEEQAKLSNADTNNAKLHKALIKIEELEEETKRLRETIVNNKKQVTTQQPTEN